jgi:hypothetical protein
MPLKAGKSNKTRNSNIKEAIASIDKKGAFGKSGKKPKAKLVQMAVAVAYQKQRASKKK